MSSASQTNARHVITGMQVYSLSLKENKVPAPWKLPELHSGQALPSGINSQQTGFPGTADEKQAEERNSFSLLFDRK